MSEKRTRNETGYRNTSSKDNGLTAHIGQKTASRLSRYCKIQNINRTKFIEECVNTVLDTKEQEILLSLSKEELVNIIIRQ